MEIISTVGLILVLALGYFFLYKMERKTHPSECGWDVGRSYIMERIKNDMEDFVINGKLTIKELYELAKKDGFEDRHLFFSVKNKMTGQHFSTDTVVDFGKGWSKDSAIMHLTWEELPHQDSCVG